MDEIKKSSEEPTFRVLDPEMTGLSDEKKAILTRSKEAAIEATFYKTASYRSQQQSPYASPYLSLADMQLPQDMSDIMRLCKYYYTFDPIIASAINSLSNFPVTDIYLEDMESFKAGEGKNSKESDTMKLYKRVFFNKLNITQLLIEIGIDYHAYGNCFIMGEFEKGPDGEKEWKTVTRLDPTKMVIGMDPSTNTPIYKWTVPEKMAQIVKRGPGKSNPEYDKIPDMVKKAVKENKALVLKKENIYHFRRATDSLGKSEWGLPLITHVLKLLMYRNVLRQAQEALAREHIVPFRVYYFQRTETATQNSVNQDYNKTAQDFSKELMKAAKDPNYKVISPVPINVLSLGGQGKSLLLTPEIDQVQSEILAGMGVPREFVFGGVSYSGSSISLKILENGFLTYRLLLLDFMNTFLIKGMAKARGDWSKYEDDADLVSAKMSDLKMQDDVQQKQLVINLNQAGKLDDGFMYKTMGIDPDKMKEALKAEALYKVELQLEIQKKQIEAEAELMIYKAQVDQQMQEQMSKMGLSMPGGQVDAQGNPIPMQDASGQAIPTPSDPSQAQVQQGQSPQGQAQQDPTLTAQQTMPEAQAQIPEDKQSQIAIQKEAIKMAQMPKADREKILGKLDEPTRVMISEYIDQARKSYSMEDEEEVTGNKSDKGIDMRPMPTQRPPRRDSLK